MATSLGARFGLNIDVVKTDAEKLDPEKDIPEKKQSEVFRILKDFLRGVKEPPSWFAPWKTHRAEAMKAKLESKNGNEKPNGDETEAEEKTDEKPEEKPEEKTGDDDKDSKANQDPVAAGFKVGDVVMGVALKSKDKWAQKCEIKEILSRHYKVTMLEGAAKGEMHKFFHGSVKAIPAPAPLPAASSKATEANAAPDAAPNAAPDAAPAPAQKDVEVAAPSPSEMDSEMRHVEELFD